MIQQREKKSNSSNTRRHLPRKKTVQHGKFVTWQHTISSIQGGILSPESNSNYLQVRKSEKHLPITKKKKKKVNTENANKVFIPSKWKNHDY